MNKEYTKKFLKMLASYPRRIFTGVSFRAIVVDSEVHKTAVLERNVNFRYSSIGRYSYISANSSAVYTKIGNFCSIASGVSIGGGAHPIDAVSTSPVFHAGHNIFHKIFCNMDFSPFKKTTIGNDVWIGNRVIVLQGVCIGDGAVIGAGSVVTKDVGPYQIWAGNPARFIRKRFSDDVIDSLEKVKWWDMYEDELNNIGGCFADPKLLISKLTKDAEGYSD